MKYLIHSVPKRLWYVEKYLVPSMIKEGIKKKDILVFNDSNNRGNLQAYLDSVDYILNFLPEEKGLWHLQDDVIISRDFKKRTEEIDTSIVHNGFVSKIYANVEKTGKQKVSDYWYSFPCIYIPNKYLKGFMEYVLEKRHIEPFKNRYVKNRYDDWFFYKYLKDRHKNDYLINMYPNIIDHVDYLMGYTTGTRRKVQVRSYYFNDLDLVKELERNIKNE